MKPMIGITSHLCTFPDSRPSVFGNKLSYVHALTQAGGLVVMIPPQDYTDVDSLLDAVDGVLLPGGEDVDPANYAEEAQFIVGPLDPLRDTLEIAIARGAIARGIPILGICRGLHIMNVAQGGTLFQDISKQRPSLINHDRRDMSKRSLIHEVDIVTDSFLYSCLKTTTRGVSSHHHQAIKTLGHRVVATASASDQVIEAIEVSNHIFAMGVQFHIEELIDMDGALFHIFTSFIKAATYWRHSQKLEGRQA